MLSLDVDARYDDSRPEGGHAVLFVAGLADIDEPLRFMLRPLDADMTDESVQALLQPHTAVAARTIDGGTEIIVGPQVTEHPELQAGAIVELTLPDHNVRAELIWPSIVPLARPRRTATIARMIAGPRGATPHAPVAAISSTPTTAFTSAAPIATPAIEAIVAPPPEKLEPREARRAPIADQAARPVATAPTPAATARTSAPPQPASAMAPTARPIAAAPPERRVQPEPTTEESLSTRPARPSDEPTDDGAARPDEAGRNDYVTFYPHARGGNLRAPAKSGEPQRPSRLSSSPLGVAVVSAAAALGIAWLVTQGGPGSRPMTVAPSVVPQAAPVVVSARPAAEASADTSIYDLLASGPASPRGVAGRDVTPLKALENAQAALLTPGAARDPEEGAYWLRRYVAALGDERTRRALTQLGSALADSSNRNFDFGKARQAWELASALGDPVAMCFLGMLHENGLAGPADRRLALTWFERAKLAGSCPGLDESIARVK